MKKQSKSWHTQAWKVLAYPGIEKSWHTQARKVLAYPGIEPPGIPMQRKSWHTQAFKVLAYPGLQILDIFLKATQPTPYMLRYMSRMVTMLKLLCSKASQ